MRRRLVLVWSLLACVGLAAIQPLHAQNNEVRLKRAWVKKFADRATIDASMTVRHTHTSANPPKDDGDIHFSGESPDVGLPFVAEMVNAGLTPQKPAVAAIKAKSGTSNALNIVGAWRLWFEHPAKKQTQGGNNAFVPDNTSPHHSFEIHPAIRIDQHDVTGSFIPIAGYQPHLASVAFGSFDKKKVTIKASSSGISLRSNRVVYNYVAFIMELTDDPTSVEDGFIAVARVFDDQGTEVANGERRMIFVEGTQPAAAIQNATVGKQLRVLGIPRIDLKAVLAMVNKHGTKQFTAQLPYEMIIVAIRP